ncbi:MAG: hypothetical protein LBT08_06725, partial [Synergistaceae bacterium]|nr:hypothetical protein [Synergistaceae bacterium]
ASYDPAKNPYLVTSVVSPDKSFRAYGTIMDNIIKSYRIDNTLTANSSGSLSNIVLDNASPVQAIGLTTVTATQQIQHSEETSASFSISGKTPGASIGNKVTDGYSYSQSETFNVLDVELRQSSDAGKKSISWQYDMKMSKFADDRARFARILTGSALLATSMFNPCQMWSWSIPTKERRNIEKFDVALEVTRAFVYASDYENKPNGHVVTNTHTKKISVTLPQPPLLAVSTQTVNTDKTENIVSVRVASQGAWTAAKSDGGDWYSIAQQNDMLHIAFKANDTGGNRSGQVIVSRNGSSDTINVSVMQFGVSQK